MWDNIVATAVGALLTLLGIMITLRHERKERDKDRHFQRNTEQHDRIFLSIVS